MDFTVKELSEKRIIGIKQCSDWSNDCPVSFSSLREVNFLHKDFVGSTKNGSMIVLAEVAESTLMIFEKLYKIEFPIHKAIPVDLYNGSDVDSMNDNNSSAFNCRKIMNKNSWSSHSYGTAIDINPEQNPYVLINHEKSTAEIYPKKGSMFLNRGIQNRGMVEPIVEIFSQHGFTEWGGNWSDRLDYHHFQIPWEEMKKLETLNGL